MNLDSLHMYLALVSADLFGIDWQGWFSYRKFVPALCRGWNLPRILFFCSTRCVVQPLGCLEKYWGHLSVCSASLCLHNVSDIFGSGSKVVWGMFGNFCVTWSEKTFQSSFSILLVARLYHPFGCYWLVALWWEYLGPIAHVWLRGSKMFGGTALHLWAVSWEVFSLPSVHIIPWQISSWGSVLPSIQHDLFCCFLISSYSVKGERLR